MLLRRRSTVDCDTTRELATPSANALDAAARMSRRERREHKARAAAAADLAARVARANRRLAQASEAFPDVLVEHAIPATPPIAHPTPAPTELETPS